MEYMHEGPRREASLDVRREFYTQVEKFFLEEIETNPELRQELENYLGYVQLMQRIAPRAYPQREALVEYIHHAIDVLAMPTLPIAPPSPHQRVAVGEHMIVSTGYPAAACWPDKKERVLRLDDNGEVRPQTPLGKIDIVRNLPQLSDEDGAMIGFARHLLKSTTDSLIDLAGLTEARGSQLSQVDVFGGVSHLARIAGRLHFSVFPIIDERERAVATNISKGVAQHVAGDVSAWKEMAKNYKPAQVAFISRDSLIEHFGPRAVAQGFQRPR